MRPGRILAGKYEVVRQLGQGWEGRNPNDRTAKFYARKLHKLRHYPILIQYHGRETFVHQGQRITFLVSEFVEGERANGSAREYHGWDTPRPENIRDDVIDMIRIFYDALGGKKHYANQPEEVKAICCGLRRSFITAKFRTAGQLRQYLETMEWS
ncbi:MAG: hypothetical protein ACRDGR_06975 [bacterium]